MSPPRLDGKVVIVTGSAGGIGTAAARRSREEGALLLLADVRQALRETAPKGVDVYFDNVGGEILDAVLTRLARGARIVICAAEAVRGREYRQARAARRRGVSPPTRRSSPPAGAPGAGG